MSSSSSTFASFTVADMSLFGQLLSQMPHRLLDDLILAVLVYLEALFSLPCCSYQQLSQCTTSACSEYTS